ncbi:unnamed protein product [Polarella glacialis]|uniref:Tyrosine specific protein phosphatases domain-containing protein n=1 Tax=Polarella glacialis TaxID=89957 RepID=A0A813LP97_POLGL|nr:unnamed protein product [Polarella glacialis]
MAGHSGQGPIPVWPPSVWWGDADSVRRLGHWQQQREAEGLPRITHVCNTAANAVPLPVEQRVEQVSYLDLEMLDAPDMQPGTGLWACSIRDLRFAVTFVEAAVASGGVVLVNCFAGHNRSGATLLAWLLLHRDASGSSLGFTPEGALRHLRSMEPHALNNERLKDCALAVADADVSAGPMRMTAGHAQECWVIQVPQRSSARSKAPLEVQEEAEESDLLMPLF